MTVTIDVAGRIVIPKGIREREGLTAGTELEIHHEHGTIRLERPRVPIRMEERSGVLVMVADAGTPKISQRQVGEAIRRQREARWDSND